MDEASVRGHVSDELNEVEHCSILEQLRPGLALLFLAPLVLALGCGVRCGRNACVAHPRECRVEYGFACASCAGKVPICAARPRDELAILDVEKSRCATGYFSYSLGCMCGSKPCFTEKQRCENRGGRWFDFDGFVDCVTGMKTHTENVKGF